MLHILILGATGTFGTALTEKLLSEHTNCEITLFSRHAQNIEMKDTRVRIVNGDALIPENLENVLKGQDVVYCAISGDKLPIVAENLVKLMPLCNVSRLIFMGAVGVYNEIPEELDGQDNVKNNPEQIPNKQAVDIIESSSLNYTILRPGYLKEGNEKDYVLTVKGQMAKGYISTISSVVNLAIRLIYDENLYTCESVSITKNMKVKYE